MGVKVGPVVVVLIMCPGDRSGASDTATTAVQLEGMGRRGGPRRYGTVQAALLW